MKEKTRAQKEADIKRASLFMWSALVIACLLVLAAFYMGFFPAKNRAFWMVAAFAAITWNYYWSKVLIGRMRAALDNA